MSRSEFSHAKTSRASFGEAKKDRGRATLDDDHLNGEENSRSYEDLPDDDASDNEGIESDINPGRRNYTPATEWNPEYN